MPSKLTFHIMGFDARVFDYLQQMQPSLVKVFNFSSEVNIDEIRRRCPNALVVYRHYSSLDYTDSADAFVAEMGDELRKLGGRGIVWEGVNEPVIANQQQARTLSDWNVRFAELMHARGEKVAAFSFSTGNPPLDLVSSLAPAALACDYIALHEYYYPNGGATDLARYREFRARLPSSARKSILITECGVDDGASNGWRTYYTQDQYLNILRDYDQQLLADPYLIGATIFQYGAVGSWQSFDVAPMANRIAQYVADQGGGAIGGGEPSSVPTIVNVTFSPTTPVVGQLVNVSITLRNNSLATLPTQEPNPGFIYEEGETFESRGFPAVTGNYRVGIDFDNRAGIDHPNRWGFGDPLAPGETRVISGAIRLRTAQAQNYWAGLVREKIAWLKDREGTQRITVTPSTGKPVITNVTLSPANLVVGDVLNVGITVRNDSNISLETQGPGPGFVYVEDDTFITRGFSDTGGNWRVGIDFANRSGVDHPYRWGLGSPLNPGESRTITGGIRLTSPQAQEYWAGLVQEHIVWAQDRQGVVRISVAPNTGKPMITNAALSPAILIVGQLLILSITVRNASNVILTTQGPDPGFIYDEGETFASRGFPAQSGNWRVGVDFTNRIGIDHPYRWGLGSPLAPGESRTITGMIRMRNAQAQNYWAGLVQEFVVWQQDRAGMQNVTVTLT